MAYGALKQGTDETNLSELEYIKTSNSIKFSNFTSCIGVVGGLEDELLGVHLPVSSSEEVSSKFDEEAVRKVIELFKKSGFRPGTDKCTICGCIGIWKSGAGDTVKQAYLALETWFLGEDFMGKVTLVDEGNGVYTVNTELEASKE